MSFATVPELLASAEQRFGIGPEQQERGFAVLPIQEPPHLLEVTVYDREIPGLLFLVLLLFYCAYFMLRLRKSLGAAADYVKTVRGVGYMFVPEAES